MTQLPDGIVPLVAADGAAAVHLPRGKMIGRRRWRFSKSQPEGSFLFGICCN
jgi:hypothetical protein